MRHVAAAILVATVLSYCSSAFAQAPGEVAPRVVDAAHKDPAVAVEISVAATAAGLGLTLAGASSHNGGLSLLGVGGLYLGPSMGSWYAGRFGGLGLAGRSAAVLMMAYGIGMLDSGDYDCDFTTVAECNRIAADAHAEQQRGEWLFVGGLAVWGAATAYDFYAAHRAAKDWNRDHHLTVAPLVAAGRTHAAGVSLAMTF